MLSPTLAPGVEGPIGGESARVVLATGDGLDLGSTGFSFLEHEDNVAAHCARRHHCARTMDPVLHEKTLKTGMYQETSIKTSGSGMKIACRR